MEDRDSTSSGSGKCVSRHWCGRAGTKGNLKGVKADINNWRNRAVPCSNIYEDLMVVSHVDQDKPPQSGLVKYLDKPGSQLRKDEVLRSCIELFQSTADDGMKVLYYSGHGESYTGNWCIEDADGEIIEFVTFEEVIDLWQKHGHPGHRLVLILDCCHSGAWVNKAERMYAHRLWGNRKEWHICKLSDNQGVTVYASCRDDELSMEDEFGGYFTKDVINHLLDGSLWEREIFETSYSSGDSSCQLEQHPQAWQAFVGRFGR